VKAHNEVLHILATQGLGGAAAVLVNHGRNRRHVLPCLALCDVGDASTRARRLRWCDRLLRTEYVQLHSRCMRHTLLTFAAILSRLGEAPARRA